MSKAHILIIDDDANTLASLARAFRLAGHEATVCDNANRALELFKSQSFDLVLSDVVMPGKDGLVLLEEYRKFDTGTVDAVIDQNPRVEARDAIDWLIQAAAGRPQPNLPPIRIQAVFKENIPP